MEFCTNRIDARGRGAVSSQYPCSERSAQRDCLWSSSPTSSSPSPTRSPPDASLKGIHQAIHGLRGQISARLASFGLISNFSGSSSSGNGSRHGAVRLTGSAGQEPHRSSAGHAAAAATVAGINAAGKSIVGVSESGDRAGHLGQSPCHPRKGEAEGKEPSVRS